MKVKIGNYPDWIGPYQIAEKLLFWLDKDEDKRVHKFGTWLAGGKDKDSLLMRVCSWIHSKQKRKVVVKLDRWDTWNMDSTLALIILPMLKQLKATQHGAGFVDDEDVPKGIGLRSTEAEPKEEEFDTDSNHFQRWEWVLYEMIFAFECKLDDSWEDAFREGEIDWESVPVSWDLLGKATMYEMKDGPNHTYKCDYDGMKVVQERITNGFRLFGKYYQNLWD